MHACEYENFGAFSEHLTGLNPLYSQKASFCQSTAMFAANYAAGVNGRQYPCESIQ